MFHEYVRGVGGRSPLCVCLFAARSGTGQDPVAAAEAAAKAEPHAGREGIGEALGEAFSEHGLTIQRCARGAKRPDLPMSTFCCESTGAAPWTRRW